MANAFTNGANGSVAKRQQWAEQIKAWQSSGESVRAFCRRRGLSEPSFYGWRRKLDLKPRPRRATAVDTGTARAKGSTRSRSKGDSSSSPASGSAGDAGFAELRLSEDGDDGERIEVALPTGERLRIGPGVSDQQLRRVLMAVREVAGC